MRGREHGDAAGDPILLLHGGNVASWSWEPQLDAFPGRRLLVPDLPGFGENADLEWVSVGETADVVAAWLREVAPGGGDVVGLSLGACVAIELAVRHPELVRRLVIASTPIAPASPVMRVLSRMQLAQWDRESMWRSSALAWGITDDEGRDRFVAGALSIRRETGQRIADELMPGIPGERLAAITAPTLALAGRDDARTVAHDSMRMLRVARPESVTRTIDGARHAINVEAPEEFNAIVREWLEADS